MSPPRRPWSEAEYLRLDGNGLVEFSDGRVDVLATPTTAHQRIVLRIFVALNGFATPGGLGEVLFAPLPVRLRPGRYREPDIVFMRARNAKRARDDYWLGADLVMEVVSADAESRRRDLVRKRKEYAAARIPEYWAIDPRESRVLVLKLAGARYATHGDFDPGERATSVLLNGFGMDVDAVFGDERD